MNGSVLFIAKQKQPANLYQSVSVFLLPPLSSWLFSVAVNINGTLVNMSRSEIVQWTGAGID